MFFANIKKNLKSYNKKNVHFGPEVFYLAVALSFGAFLFCGVVLASQSLTPSEDISNTDWMPEPLYSQIGTSSADDSDWIENKDLKDGESFTVGLSPAEDPGVLDGHTIYLRTSASSTEGEYYMEVSLLQGDSVMFTSSLQGPLKEDFQTYSIPVPEDNVAELSDYSDLAIEVSPSVSSEGSKEDVAFVSWLMMELPSTATLPLVETLEANNISISEAELRGDVIERGSGELVDRGFVYATSSLADPGNVTPQNSGYDKNAFSVDEPIEGEYSVRVDGLKENTEYFFRAFAENAEGVSYGGEMSFITSEDTESGGSFETMDSGGDDPVLLNNNSEEGPIITSIELNEGKRISPVEGTTTNVTASATVSVSGGWENIDENSLTGVVYRDGVGFDCQADPNNCYSITDMSLQDCASDTCSVVGSVDLYYFAEPTDEGEYVNEGWRTYMSVLDNEGREDTATSSAVDLMTLLAFSVIEEDIDYGEMELGEDSGDSNKVTTIRNTGNSTVGVDVLGEDMTHGEYIIDATNQRFSTTTFVYGSAGEELLNEFKSTSLSIPKATSTEYSAKDILYWGLGLPEKALSSGKYTGKNHFLAVPVE